MSVLPSHAEEECTSTALLFFLWYYTCINSDVAVALLGEILPIPGTEYSSSGEAAGSAGSVLPTSLIINACLALFKLTWVSCSELCRGTPAAACILQPLARAGLAEAPLPSQLLGWRQDDHLPLNASSARARCVLNSQSSASVAAGMICEQIITVNQITIFKNFFQAA